MIKKVDLTSPVFIILFVLIDLQICEFFFFELSIYSHLVTISGSLIFLFVTYILLQKNFIYINIKYKVVILKEWLFKIIILLSFGGSLILVYIFSEKFDFLSIFLFPELLQLNAIVNSLGYLLYLNILIVPFSIYMIFFRKEKILLYIIISIFSLFFLYFAGIKSYIFQAFITTIVMVIVLSSFKKSIIGIIIFIIMIFLFFIFYDMTLDKSALSVTESLNRFLAYFTGSFATGDLYLINNWDSPYFGLRVFEFIYKLLSFGDIKQIDYVVFYNINGYELNVVPLFQLTIIEGNVLLQIIIVTMVSLIYVFYKNRMIRDYSLINILLYSYIVSSLLISLIFANIFGELTFYVMLFLIEVITFSNKFLKIKKI